MVTKNTKIKDIVKTPAGHDIIMKACSAFGISGDVLTKGPLSNLTLEGLSKLTMGKIVDEDFVESFLGILNSEKDYPLTDNAPIEKKWWKEAVFYQIYPRSFKDSDGDGIGDLKGIIEKLDYLKDLGVDAIWCSPIYDSPNDDNGYDIRNYMKIMDEFGTMKDFDKLLKEVHKRDMKLIMDLVINHSSDEHEWFVSSATDPESPYKDYYIWRDGNGDNPPNNWDSIFSGSAWNYYPERKQWALHLFSKKQMDFNWENENLRKDLYKMINWWLKKGVDGFRLDVISFISKTDGLPVGNELIGALMGAKGVEHYFYGPKLHKFLHEMNENTFSKFDAFTVGECQGTGIEMSKLMTGDYREELSVVFSFDHVENPGKKRFSVYKYDLRPMAKELVNWQLNYGNHCWPTVFVENHDLTRMTSKVCPDGYYRDELSKLLALMQMTFKGVPFIYQGQELGMTNADFKSIDDIRDVESLNLFKELREKGMSEEEAFKLIKAGTRDHGRTPMCWSDEANAGFTTGTPWIEVIGGYEKINAETEMKDKDSVLNFYRMMTKLRHENSTLVYGDFKLANKNWKDVLTYYRTDKDGTFFVELNLTAKLQKKPVCTTGFELIATNAKTKRVKEMLPFEANLYKLR